MTTTDPGIIVPPDSPSSDPNHLHGLSTQTSSSVAQNSHITQSSIGHLPSSRARVQSIPSAVSIHPGQLQAWISSPRQPRSPASPSPVQTASTPNTASNTPPTQPLDEFRDPIPLTCTTRPGSKHYPYACLSLEHEERAPQLKGILLEAVIQSKAYLRLGFKKLWLRDCRDKISLREGMCGASPAEAKPSIIITCPPKICSMLRTELSSEGTRFQYAPDVTPGPAFDLYFCASNRAYQRRWCTVATKVDPFDSEDVEESATLVGALTMCGARINAIEDGGQDAASCGTASCIIHIKGVPYLLTSAHPFCSLNLEEDSLDALLAEDDGEDNSEIFYAEEDEHHVADNMGYHDSVPVECPTEADTETYNSSSEYDSSCMIIPGFADLGSDGRDCDWAVRPINEASERLPNAYSPGPMSPGLRYITEVANGYSREQNADNRVHVLTSTGVKAGTLLPGRLMISGLSGRGFCDVLVVNMERNSDIVDGDSGSLVVNATTTSAYGHVVATSPNGDAYVVPLHDTICQIKTFFATTDVRLPDPLSSLTEIALFYLDNKQIDLAQRSLVALGNLVSQVCDSRKWQRVCHWVETCAARGTLISMSDDKFKGNYYDRDEDVETLKVPLTANYILQQLMRSEYMSVGAHSTSWTFSKHVRASLSVIAKHVLLETEQRHGCLTYTFDETWLGVSATTDRNCQYWTKRSRQFPQQVFLNRCWRCTLGTRLTRKIPNATNKTLLLSSCIDSEHLNSCSPWMSRGWTYQEAKISPRWTTRSRENLQSCFTMQQDWALMGVTPRFAPLKHLSDPLEQALASQSYRGEQLGSGGFATVYRFTLPGTFHGKGFNTGTTQFAMKIISRKTTTYSLWATEKQALERLTKSNNPHIIELLASRCTDEDYRLLFPLAQCTMDELMQSDPLPSQELSLWMAEQFYGLASALESMHNMTSQECVRHGDLKPENILWFSNDTSGPKVGSIRDPTAGRLVIADLGLAKFHKITSRKRQLEREQTIELDTENRHTSLADRRYAAPEIEIPTTTYSDSRAYDIWSFACVMLEFLVWYMHGADGRQRLRRSLQSKTPGRFAPFWNIDMKMQKLVFSLQSQVSEQLQMLQDIKQENAKLQGTIDLILYGGLLDPDPDLRPTAREIGKMFSRVVSGLNNEYLHPSSPAWTRSWAPPVANSLRSHLSLRPLPDPTRPAEQLLVGTGTKEVGATEEIEPQGGRIDTSDHSESKREPSIKQKCPYCSQRGRPVALKYHVRAQHRNQKPLECPLCGYLYLDQKHCPAHCLGCSYPILIDQLRSPYTTSVYDRGIKQSSPFRTVFDENSKAGSPTPIKRKFEGDGEDETNSDTRTDKRAKVKRPAASAQLPQMRSGRVRRHPDDDFHGDGSCVT